MRALVRLRCRVVASLCVGALVLASAAGAVALPGPPVLFAQADNVLGYYVEGAALFKKAADMAPGPERDKAWREAAQVYKTALGKAPGRDEAPEAAFNGAHCFKQVGEREEAAAMLTLLVAEYGKEDILAKLEKGDPRAAPPSPPDSRRYQERLKHLKMALDSLVAFRVALFDHRAAVELYDTIARARRFVLADRRAAARNALVLHASLGDKDKTKEAWLLFLKLEPPAADKAEMEFLVARTELAAWDERRPDEGENKQARVEAQALMEGYHKAYKAVAAAAPYVVEAAYHAYKLRLAVKDPKAGEWAKSTVAAFDKLKASSPVRGERSPALGSRQADMAAEVAYSQIDAELKKEHDYATGHHRYQGTAKKVLQSFDDDARVLEKYDRRLEAVITTYDSRLWTLACRVRQGSLYDSLRTGLYNTRAPALKLYTPKEELVIETGRMMDPESIWAERASDILLRRREEWRAAQHKKLDWADKEMIKRYVEAFLRAKEWQIRSPEAHGAIRRLAFYTAILGNSRLRELLPDIVDASGKKRFEYQDGMFERGWPGLSMAPRPSGVALSLPIGARK